MNESVLNEIKNDIESVQERIQKYTTAKESIDSLSDQKLKEIQDNADKLAEEVEQNRLALHKRCKGMIDLLNRQLNELKKM